MAKKKPTSRARRPTEEDEDRAPVESAGSDQGAALSPSQLSAIIRAVEDRLLEEIERRGGLSRGAF